MKNIYHSAVVESKEKKIVSEIFSFSYTKKYERFLKYFIVGVSSFILDTAILYFLKVFIFFGDGEKVLNLVYITKLISSFFGFLLSFFLNKNWSFKDNVGSTKSQATKMFIVYVANIFIAAVLFTIYFDILKLFFENTFVYPILPLVANALETGTRMFGNFFVYKIFVFGVKNG